jgi:hypothetical protein
VGADDLTDRRGLLRRLAARAADSVREVRAAHNALRSGDALKASVPESTSAELLPAQLPERDMQEKELDELAREHKLDHRLHDVRRLCRVSVRFAAAPGDKAVRSEVRGAPTLGASIDLVEANAAGAAELPRAGALSIRFEPGELRNQAPWDAGTCRVTFDATSEYGGPGARPVALAREFVLPRVWSDAAMTLGLDAAEQSAWEALRLSAAAAQGVEPFDVGPRRPIHRLLGWPDDRGGWMPLAAAMLAAGLHLGDGPPPAHAPTDEVAAAAARWRLLLQLSADPGLGIAPPAGRHRLYVWIDENDLAARDVSRVRAFLI